MSNQVKIIALLVGAGVQFGLLVVNLIITSKMQIEDRGVYALVVAVVMTVSGFCNLGFSNALIKRMHSEELSKIYITSIANLIFIQVFCAVIVATLLLLTFPVISYDLLSEFLYVVVLVIVGLLLRSYGQAVLLGLNKIFLFQISKVLPVLLFAIILLAQNKYEIEYVLFAWMASELLLILYLVLSIIVVIKVDRDNENNSFHEDLRFGLKSLFGHTAFIEGYKFDLIILGYIIPAAELAIYSVSKSVALVLRFVPQSLSQVAYPAILRANKDEKINVLKKFIFIAIMSSVLLVVIGYSLFISVVIDFLGEEYVETQSVVFIMFLGVFAYVPRRISYEYLKAVNKPSLTSKIEVYVLLSYLSLVLLFEAFNYSGLLPLSILILVINVSALFIVYRVLLGYKASDTVKL